MNYSEQILKARFEQLPEGVKEAIIATPWKDKLAQIASKHRLHIDQADRLGKETVIVMFGLDHPDNLVYNIAKNVEVSEEKAEAIAEDLNREIFLKVRESLKKIFEEKKEEVEEKKSDTEEIPSREDILREIEDKEHHNLPSIDRTEHHLEIPFPSEIVEKPTNLDLETKHTSEIVAGGNQAPGLGEIKNQPQRAQKSQNLPQLEPIITMNKDIFKAKMSGTVSMPKETIEISDTATPTKVKSSDVGKVDPYREQISL